MRVSRQFSFYIPVCKQSSHILRFISTYVLTIGACEDSCVKLLNPSEQVNLPQVNGKF